MSNALVYDPLLVQHLARELDRELRGRACAAAPLFSAGLTAVLPLQGSRALRLDLHPTRGWVRLVSWNVEDDDLDAVCLGVDAAPDERVISIRLRTADRFTVGQRTLAVELQTNQWNAVLVNEEDQRVLTVLRGRSAGDRLLRPGQRYQPPPPVHRFGVTDVELEQARAEWERQIGGAAPADRRGVLLRGFAFTGSASAAAILGAALQVDDPAEVRAAFDRWWELRTLEESLPVLLHLGNRLIPYPVPLHGVRSEPVNSLLQAMDLLADREPEEPGGDVERELLLRRVDGRIATAERKVARLQEQIARPGEVDRLRGYGDLLLSNLRLVPRGVDRVRLMGWDRTIVEIALDPALEPAENANRWYDEARRRARADQRLPGLLEIARIELQRWRNARSEAEAEGRLPAWAVRELERSSRSPEGGSSSDQEQARPYRVYRTSGGLEVRVGRSAKDNDRLTFGHPSPNDVWLHARSVAGSHVILRWTDAEGSPPARDLEEAATLAALYSKARSSALVPVDWTRRKHVRKPRGAAPGAVIPQRVKTLFVAPDEKVEERTRE